MTANPPHSELGDIERAIPRPLRRDADFRRYWLARLISFAGSSVTIVAMPVLIYQTTHSSFWTSAVAFFEGLPYLIFGLLAGAIGDHANPRRIMIATDSLSAVLLLSVPLAYLAGVLTPVHALAAAFGINALFVFFDAANWGILPALVGRDRLSTARAAVAGSNNLAELLVPVAASASLAVLAAPFLIAVDAVSFAASALLIRGMTCPVRGEDSERRTVSRGHLISDVRNGLAFLWREPVVRVQTATWTVQCFAGGLLVGQMVPWANHTLRIPLEDGRLGALYGAWAVGGVIATLVYPKFSRRLGDCRVTLIALPLSALGAVAVDVVHSWLLAMAVLVAWAVAFVCTNLAAMTSRQKLTPDALQARVSTTGRMLSFGAGWPLGAAAGGGVAAAAGPQGALALGAGLMVLTAIGVWFSPLRAGTV